MDADSAGSKGGGNSSGAEVQQLLRSVHAQLHALKQAGGGGGGSTDKLLQLQQQAAVLCKGC
jgi:hypothetical protein